MITAMDQTWRFHTHKFIHQISPRYVYILYKKLDIPILVVLWMNLCHVWSIADYRAESKLHKVLLLGCLALVASHFTCVALPRWTRWSKLKNPFQHRFSELASKMLFVWQEQHFFKLHAAKMTADIILMKLPLMKMYIFMFCLQIVRVMSPTKVPFFLEKGLRILLFLISSTPLPPDHWWWSPKWGNSICCKWFWTESPHTMDALYTQNQVLQSHLQKEGVTNRGIFFIDCKAREIMHLVASVRQYVCLSALSRLNRLTFVHISFGLKRFFRSPPWPLD